MVNLGDSVNGMTMFRVQKSAHDTGDMCHQVQCAEPGWPGGLGGMLCGSWGEGTTRAGHPWLPFFT